MITRQLTISFYTATTEMSQTPINCDGVRPETSSLLSQTHIDNKLHTWVPAQSRTNGLTNNDHPASLIESLSAFRLYFGTVELIYVHL